MKYRNILYLVITIICVIAIIIAVYYQVFKNNENLVGDSSNNNQNSGQNDTNIDLEKIKNEFNSLFTNQLNLQGYDVSSIQKQDQNNEIIYMAFDIKEELPEKYSVNLKLPAFNIDSETTINFNNMTQTIFANKASEVLANKGAFTIYNIEYTAYVNDNIVSLVIKSTLKEGNSAQRVIVQTYNYDIKTGKQAVLNDILLAKGIDKSQVNEKIEKYVSFAQEQAEAISQATSQAVYKRDLNNAMYITDNISNFFLGENGKIYIVYAYGNLNFTSEMDIITVE